MELRKYNDLIRNVLGKNGIYNVSIRNEKNYNNKDFIEVSFEIWNEVDYIEKANLLFYSEEQVKNFLVEMESLYYANLLGDKNISFFPDNLNNGSIFSFKYKDEDGNIIRRDQLKQIAMNNRNKTISNMKKDIEFINQEINDVLSFDNKIKSEIFAMKSMYEDIRTIKEKANSSLGQFKLLNEKINFGKAMLIRKTTEAYEIDINEVKLRIGNANNKNEINQFLEEVRKKILDGYEIKIDVSNIDNDDIDVVNYFIKELKNMIIKTKEDQKEFFDLYSKKCNDLISEIKNVNELSFGDFANAIKNMKIEELEDYSYDLPMYEISQIYNIKHVNANKIYDEKINYKSDVFKKIQKEQEEKLSEKEKNALNLYKSQLYRAINPIISYLRKNNKTISDIANDKVIAGYIKTAHDEMVEASKGVRGYQSGDSSQRLRIDDIFDKYPRKLPSLEQYTKLVLDSLIHIESALKKVSLDEDIVVYRGVIDSNLENENNIFLSTTMDIKQVREFIKVRSNQKRSNKVKIIRIIIPKGSPLIAYTSELMAGKINEEFPFGDSQKEILLDSANYDFKEIGYEGRSHVASKIGSESFEIIDYIANSKIEVLDNEKGIKR